MDLQFQRLTLYTPVLDQYLNSPEGEVGRYLRVRCELIMIAAKRQVGVDTGGLRESIRMAHSRDTLGQSIWVGSTNGISLIHHEGTKPHLIVPHQARILRFSVGARSIQTRMVRHPGTKPNRYLSDQLYLIRI